MDSSRARLSSSVNPNSSNVSPTKTTFGSGPGSREYLVVEEFGQRGAGVPGVVV